MTLTEWAITAALVLPIGLIGGHLLHRAWNQLRDEWRAFRED